MNFGAMHYVSLYFLIGIIGAIIFRVKNGPTPISIIWFIITAWPALIFILLVL